MSHNHTHPHNHTHNSTGNIKMAFFLNLAFSLVELVGGLYTNSIAILSDALHDFGDSCSLGISRYFQKLSQKKKDAKYSYGYRRFSLLGALISSIVLLIGSIFVISESIQRLLSPETINVEGMLILAIIGILVNGIAFLRLKKGHSLNERAVGLHLLEDVLGRVAVLIGSIVMLFVEIQRLDSALSIGIAAYILFNIYRNLRDVLRVVLQGTPKEIEIEEIEKKLTPITGIQTIHDIHLRSMDGEYTIASLHLVLDPALSLPQTLSIKQQVKQTLKKLNIHHITLEIEQEGEPCDHDECT